MECLSVLARCLHVEPTGALARCPLSRNPGAEGEPWATVVLHRSAFGGLHSRWKISVVMFGHNRLLTQASSVAHDSHSSAQSQERRMRSHRLLTGLVFAMALACRSNDEPPPAQPDAGIQSDAGTPVDAGTSTTVAEHLQVLNEAFTAKRSECSPFSHSHQDFWIAEQKSDLEAGAIAGRLVFHPDEVATCLESIAAMSCAEFKALGWVRECSTAMFEPQIAPGGECYATAECIGAWCDTGSSCPGRCVAYLQEGESCVAGVCDHDTYCGPGQVCVARKQMDAACWANLECGEGLICDALPSAASPVQGKCVSKVGHPEGRPCAPMECASGLECLGDSLDGVMGGTCVASPAPNAGDVCDMEKGCGSSLVCAGLDFSQAEAESHCVPWADLGEPCVVLGNGLTGCKLGLRCVEGLCAELPSTGPCWQQMGGKCAYPNICNEQLQCVPRPAIGEACTDPFECADGRCVDGMCVANCWAP